MFWHRGNGEDYKIHPNPTKAWQIEAYPILLSTLRKVLGPSILSKSRACLINTSILPTHQPPPDPVTFKNYKQPSQEFQVYQRLTLPHYSISSRPWPPPRHTSIHPLHNPSHLSLPRFPKPNDLRPHESTLPHHLSPHRNLCLPPRNRHLCLPWVPCFTTQSRFCILREVVQDLTEWRM